MIYAECPHCGTRYPTPNLFTDPRDRPAPGKVFTIKCASCGADFDVKFSQRKRRLFGLIHGALMAASKRR